MATKQTVKQTQSAHAVFFSSSILLGIALLTCVVIITALFYMQVRLQNGDHLMSNDTYYTSALVDQESVQSVFLTNGQVYFGTLTAITRDSLVLDDVFYLQENTNIQSGEENAENAEAQGELSLVKLGTNEIHQPQDQMVISRDHVLFWENLKADSEVATAIAEYVPEE